MYHLFTGVILIIFTMNTIKYSLLYNAVKYFYYINGKYYITHTTMHYV